LNKEEHAVCFPKRVNRLLSDVLLEQRTHRGTW
jgi:hypothetical protein